MSRNFLQAKRKEHRREGEKGSELEREREREKSEKGRE